MAAQKEFGVSPEGVSAIGLVASVDADIGRVVNRFLKRRDSESFRLIYRVYTPSMYRVAFRLSGGRSAAEDVVQEAWLRVVAQPERLRDVASIRGFLLAVVMNICREQRRHGRLEPLHDDAQSGVSSEHVVADHIDIECALRKLAPGYREVLVLHDIEGYTHEEIAEALGIAKGTSKSQLFRAREALKAAVHGMDFSGADRPAGDKGERQAAPQQRQEERDDFVR